MNLIAINLLPYSLDDTFKDLNYIIYITFTLI